MTEKVDDSHPDIVKKKAVMQRCLDKRKYASNCFFEHQKKNYESLFQYELLEAQALYEQGSKASRDSLLTRLDFKRRKLEAGRELARDRLEARLRDLKNNTPKQKSTAPMKATEIREDLRAMARSAIALVKESEVSTERKTPSEKKQDVLKISTTMMNDQTRLTIEDETFTPGDKVIVASNLIANQVRAYICSINPTQIHVRTTAHGRDLRLNLYHFQYGRLSLQKD